MASAATPRGGLSLAGRQPAAALVMRDAAPTDSAQPVATLADSSAPPAATAPATVETPPPPTGGTTTYVVQRGDTLWGIAQQQLGDPLRWSEIYQLNQGRPQPGGVTLTDPHWIDPGWTLVLPAASMTPATLTTPQQATPEQTTPQQAAPQQAAQPSRPRPQADRSRQIHLQHLLQCRRPHPPVLRRLTKVQTQPQPFLIEKRAAKWCGSSRARS